MVEDRLNSCAFRLGSLARHGVSQTSSCLRGVNNSLVLDISGIIHNADLLFSSAALRLELRAFREGVLDRGGVCGISLFSDSLYWLPSRRRRLQSAFVAFHSREI